MKKIILLEPNPYHNEVLPGIAKYFEDLNYVVDIYIRKEVVEQEVFCRYKVKGNIVSYSMDSIADILMSDEIQEYDFLFLSSMEHGENGKLTRFLDEINCVPKTKYGVLGMYHTNYLVEEFNDNELQKQRRLFFISNFQTRGYDASSLSPVYFVDKHETTEVLTETRKILTIGTSTDFSLLSEAYWRLSKEERKKIEIRHIGIVPKGKMDLKGIIYNFIIFCLGWIIPKYRKCKNIIYLGKLDFPEMYEEIENADFILALIDPAIGNQARYLKYSTSGIRQLIIGFNKCSIMHDDIAKAYDLTKDAYIGFSTGKVNDALRKAIYMTEEDYWEMEREVEKVRNKIYNKSLYNLKKVLEEIRSAK